MADSGLERDARHRDTGSERMRSGSATRDRDHDRDRHRDRDRSSRRSGRSDDRYDDRHPASSSSRRKRDAYDDGADDYERDRERRRINRDRDYSDDLHQRRSREDDYYGGGGGGGGGGDDDYYSSRSSRSRRDRDDRYGGYAGRNGRPRYDDGDDYRSGQRRGGGGDWRNDGPRDSSPALRRSPTPEGTIPLSERPRPFTKWDIPAPGFEGTPALAAKATGMFGIPGHSRILGGPMGPVSQRHEDDRGGRGGPPRNLPPIHMGAGGLPPGMPARPDHVFGDMPGRPHGLPPMPQQGLPPHPGQHGANGGGSSGPDPSNRQARRLYLGNVTYEATESNLCGFFNEKMRELKLATGDGDPCIAAQVNGEKGYAFLEFRTPDEATNAMSFDGIVFQSQSLKIRRPKDYTGPDVRPPPNVHVPGVISTNVPDSPNKIFVGGLPTYLTDEQIIELLQSFGELRAFNLVKESGTGASKGFAFCEYVDPALTDLACQGLNDMELGERRLVVQRASVGNDRRQPNGPHSGTGANAGPLGSSAAIPASLLQNFAGDGGDAGEPTRCMVMLNMVTPDELQDDDEYADIVEDIRDECTKYGAVTDVRIPRPEKKSKGAAAQTWRRTLQDGGEVKKEEGSGEREGVGRVYVRYDEVEQCAAALRAIAGRQFGGRLVICAYLKESDWPGDEDGGQNAEDTAAQASGPAYTGGESAAVKREEDAAAAEAAVAQAGPNGRAPGDDEEGEEDMAMGDD